MTALKLAAQKALEACPFCGNAPRYLAENPGFYTERVICDHCGFHLKPEQWRERAAKAKAKASDASYVCPQCGPDPRGPDVHARERHEWPPRSALQREPGRSIARITGLCFVGAEGEPACIAGVEGCKVAHTVVKYATPPLLQKEEGEPVAWAVIGHDGKMLLAENRTLLAYFDNEPRPLVWGRASIEGAGKDGN